LEEGSTLEVCYYLGKLREPNHFLNEKRANKGGKNQKDIMMKVPMLATSMMVQRMINCERLQRQQAEDELTALKAELQELKGGE
jgi:hypothetical protein